MQEVRTFQLEDVIDENDEMDMSDDENYGSSNKNKRARVEKSKKKVSGLFQVQTPIPWKTFLFSILFHNI